MVDPLDIKKTYANMSNPQLMDFVRSEGLNLTSEALEIMRTEFTARRMPLDIIESIENGTYVKEKADAKKLFNVVPDQGSTTALAMAMNEKRDGKDNELIVYHLMEEGLDEEHARIIIEQLKPEANVLLKRSNNAMLSSIFITCAGVALRLISPEKGVITFLDIAATCTVIFGILRFLKSYFEHNKFKRVIRNISIVD